MNRSALEKLFAALERAGVEYSNLHRAMTAIFSSRGCGADSEGLADITLLDRLAQKIDKGEEVRRFSPYSKEIAKRVHKEYLKEREKFRKAIAEFKYLNKDVLEFVEKPDLRRMCQESCVRSLPETDRQLMVDYYLTGLDRVTLAKELGLLLDTLRTRIHRLKLRLAQCVEDCRRTAS